MTTFAQVLFALPMTLDLLGASECLLPRNSSKRGDGTSIRTI
jgi:hypothetical protein